MMAQQLAGARVLIVEDEYYLAEDTRAVLAGVGAEVLGPVATVQDARALIEREPAIDGVLLDVNLRGELAFEVADALRLRGIPFAFVTGYDQASLPPRFAGTAALEKPFNPEQVVGLVQAMAAARQAPAVGRA